MRRDDESDLYQRFLKEGIVFVQGAIDEERANTVVAQLLYADRAGTQGPVSVYLNSPGGELRAALSIYDTMQTLGRDVKTVCLGVAAGPAALLLAAGRTGMRYANPHARIGLQRPGANLSGTAAEIDVRARELIKLRAQFNELLARHTGQPLERVERDTDGGLWLDAAEAKAYGIIDGTLTADPRP